MRKRRFFEQHDSKSDLIDNAKEAFDFLVEEVIMDVLNQDEYYSYLPPYCFTDIGLWVIDDNALGIEFGGGNSFDIEPDDFSSSTKKAIKSAESEEDALEIVDEDFFNDVNDLVESQFVYETIELPVSKKELEEELWKAVEQHRACEERISGAYHDAAIRLWEEM